MTDLPLPDAVSRERSAHLCEVIREAIVRAGGGISFADFMHMALYKPGCGYYVSGLRKFGEGGDFITAPELSPLFARCIANQAAEVLRGLPEGDILEFGAGSGALAGELLTALSWLNCVPRRYYILEVSPDLRESQRKTLAAQVPGLVDKIEWLSGWPSNFSGFVLANEVLDAMPVERFRWRAGQVEQQWVVENNGLSLNYGPAHGRLNERVEVIRRQCGREWPDGFQSEVSLLVKPWLEECARVIRAGALLLIDYGYPGAEYYHPAREYGTLRCHYCHRAHDDPLLFPGLQDITAHVDFTAVAEAGELAGLVHEGFVTQQQLLVNCGLEAVAERLFAEADERTRYELSRQIQQLTLPNAMGEAFHAIGLSKNLANPMSGFASNDRSARL